MKNQLIDLNNHLFAQLERLGNESLKGEGLKQELDRSKAITLVAVQVVSNARLALDAKIFQSGGNSLPVDGTMPAMIQDKDNA